MEINRYVCQGNKWTFEMKPIKDLINKYINIYGKESCRILCPFAGITRFDNEVSIYIDINPNIPNCIHGDAIDILKQLSETSARFDLILLDPPYTYFQAVHTYNNIKCQDITVIRNLCQILCRPNGRVISFGYNSTGMSNKRNFSKEEIILINLGGSHNDIIVVVEKNDNL